LRIRGNPAIQGGSRGSHQAGGVARGPRRARTVIGRCSRSPRPEEHAMTRPLSSFAFLLAASASLVLADDPKPVVRVVTASDLPPLPDLPRAGDYTVWAWGPKDGWAMAVRGKTIALLHAPEAGDGRPIWYALGKVAIDPKSPPTLRVAPARWVESTAEK